MSEENNTKKCPFCGEEIKITAKKCKHCKEFLPETQITTSTKTCPYCGGEVASTAKKCKHCGEWLDGIKENAIVNKIADCQKISNILWLIISIIQILTIICIIAGIWNLIATIASWNMPQKILHMDRDIPGYYEGIVGLIIVAIVNFLLGGLIGVILVGFDFYIRHLVLENRHLFVNQSKRRY